jgi:hypothetical protein
VGVYPNEAFHINLSSSLVYVCLSEVQCSQISLAMGAVFIGGKICLVITYFSRMMEFQGVREFLECFSLIAFFSFVVLGV